jgi:hypothetical protein
MGLVGCDTRQASPEWAGTVDTLPDGEVLTRSPREGVWDSTSAWRLESDLEIGTATDTGPELFGDVWDFEVGESGQIFVLDAQAFEVRAFDVAGEYLWSVGRSGGGPGEFQFPAGLARAPDGRLWVPDPGNARYTVFDTAGTYVASIPRRITGIMIPWQGGVDTAGRPFDYARVAGRAALLRYRSAPIANRLPAPLDTLPLPAFDNHQLLLRDANGAVTASVRVPFTPVMVRYVDPRDYLWYGVNGEYRIIQGTFAGDTVRIIEHDFEPLPVRPEEVDSVLEVAREALNAGGRLDGPPSPGQKPAYHWFTVDDRGFLWVYPYVASDEAGRALDVFDPKGRYLGRVHAGFQFDPGFLPIIRGSMLYTVRRDEMDVEYIVRARIVGRR